MAISFSFFHNAAGLEIATNTVAFATKFFPFATKISGEVASLWLIFTSAVSKQKESAVANLLLL